MAGKRQRGDALRQAAAARQNNGKGEMRAVKGGQLIAKQRAAIEAELREKLMAEMMAKQTAEAAKNEENVEAAE